MAEEKQPDVVLTDVRMKKMDGLTLIERAKQAGWHTSFVVISAYRDFEYAQKACRNGALAYLVKPIEEEELEHYFAAAAVGIDLACRVANQKEYEMKQFLLESQMRKKLKEKYRVWTKKSPDGAFCYLVDLGETPGLELLKEMLGELRTELKSDFVSALSAPRRGLSGMKDAYRTALRLFEAASEAGAGFLAAREQQEIAPKTQYSLDVEGQLLSAVRKNDRQQVKKIYEKFIYTLPGDEAAAKVYLHRLAVRTEFALEDAGMLPQEIRAGFQSFYQLLETVALLKLVDLLYQLFLSVVEQRIASDVLPAEEYFKDYIASSLTYIREHLQEESLSITEVSESVYLNSVYFGRMFKKVMNVSFKRYVQNVRMEKAKELLLEEKESIAGICMKVGIPNQSYFSQLFKQNTGVLPSEYKRSLR